MKSRISALTIFISICSCLCGQIINNQPTGNNLAFVATSSGSARYVMSFNFLNDGLTLENTAGMRSGGNRPPMRPSTQWVQYDWIQPVTTGRIAIYLWNYRNTVRLPQSYRIKYWDGNDFVIVKNASGLGLENNKFNLTTFDPVKTTKLRLELDSVDRFTVTLLEWMVFQAENTPNHPPIATAGADRSVIIGGKTYLSGKTKSVTPVTKIIWKKKSGSGNVVFDKPGELATTAVFSDTGEYLTQHDC